MTKLDINQSVTRESRAVYRGRSGVHAVTLSLADTSQREVPLQVILEQRRYVVISTNAAFEAGTVVTVSQGVHGGITFLVTGVTDRADFIEQCAVWNHVPVLGPLNTNRYYRVIAE